MFRHIPPVTKNLLIINILIFLVMAFSGRDGVIEKYGALHYFSSPDFNPAQLFTYMFLHAPVSQGGIQHIFFNMFALFMFGPQIEYTIGPKKFLFYYITCGVGAALVQLGVYAIMIGHLAEGLSGLDFKMLVDQGVVPLGMDYAKALSLYTLVNTSTVGASGAIFGVLLAYGMLFPNARLMLLIPPIPVKAKWLVLAYGLIEVFALLGMQKADNVAHLCHIGGMLIGLGLILYWKKKGQIHGGY